MSNLGGMRLAAPICALFLASCGTYVPGIQEIGGSPAGQQLVVAIIQNVTCEVRDSVNDVYSKKHWQKSYMDKWGAQITLNLTIEEKTAINPTENWIPPSPVSSIFNLMAGGTVSSDAIRNR